MNNLALIPARGGSKRILKKNIKDFLGKPILAYSIEAAIKSGFFSEVLVSTDDREIAAVAEKYGAVVPFLRNEATSGDFATLSDVIEEVKQVYISREFKFEFICCILPTAPLISQSSLMKGFEMLKDGDFDSVRPMVRFSYPVQKAVRIFDGLLESVRPEVARMRSQDFEPYFHDAGQFYWMKFDAGLKGTKKGGFEISELEVQDIDNETDWALSEMKYRLLNRI